MTRSTLNKDELGNLARTALTHAPGTTARQHAVARMLDYCARTGAIRNWAVAAMPPANTSALVDQRECEQIIAERIATICTTLDHDPVTRADGWAGWLYWKAKQAVRDELQRGSYTVASGMATVLRRYARVQAATELARDLLGRTPTQTEIIDVANAGREARAAKDGTLVTHRDFHYTHLGKSIDETITDHPDLNHADTYLPEAPDVADNIAAIDKAARLATDLVRTVTARCDYDPDITIVGQLWVEAVIDGTPAPTARTIARTTGWVQSRAAAALLAWSTTVSELRDAGELDSLKL